MVSERFSPAESTGISRGGKLLAEAIALIERSQDCTNAGASETNRFKRECQRGEAQEQLLEQFARQNNCWIENTDITLAERFGEYYAEGGEARVYDNGWKVVKAIGLDYFISPQLALDRIVLHNYLFGTTTPLYILAFGRNEEDAFQIIVEQPFIIGKKLTIQEIEEYTAKLGFELKNARNWTYATAV